MDPPLPGCLPLAELPGFSLSLERPRRPEADVERVEVVREEPVAVRGPQVERPGAIAAAAEDARGVVLHEALPRARSDRQIVAPEAVEAPLENVPGRVVEAERVRAVGADRAV